MGSEELLFSSTTSSLLVLLFDMFQLSSNQAQLELIIEYLDPFTTLHSVSQTKSQAFPQRLKQISLDLQEVAKTLQRSPVTLHRVFPNVM